MKRGWTEVALGEVLHWRAPECPVSATESYVFAGVYSNGRGVFRKQAVLGSSFQYSTLNKLRTLDFVYPKLMAWEGALGVVPKECDGCFVSPEFQVFDHNPTRLSPRYLDYLMRRPAVWSDLAQLSPGTNVRRRRLNPREFLSYKIPLPPLAEQQRIAARLDAIESRLARVRRLREEAKTERDALTTSLHLAMSADRSMRFHGLLSLREEECTVVSDGSYPQVGIRSFGLGLFKKSAVAGAATTYRTFNVLRPGMFVMSQVKGWEGAIGVCGEEFDGWFVSPEYRTFECIENECHPAYLAHLASTPWFRDQLAAATRGVGARRERIRPEMLLGMEIPFPSFKQQQDAIHLLDRVQRASALSEVSSASESVLLPSLLEQIFNS